MKRKTVEVPRALRGLLIGWLSQLEPPTPSSRLFVGTVADAKGRHWAVFTSPVPVAVDPVMVDAPDSEDPA